MTTDESGIGDVRSTPRHARTWALRILPPLLLLWPLALRNGTGLYFSWALTFPFALWSFVTFCSNLIRWRPTHLVRPGLCLAIFLAWPAYVGYTMVPAVRYADALAAQIQLQCNSDRRCPRAIAGFEPGYGTLHGGWVQWRIRYFTDGTRFSIHVMMGPDVSRVATGGVGKGLVPIDAPRE